MIPERQDSIRGQQSPIVASLKIDSRTGVLNAMDGFLFEEL